MMSFNGKVIIHKKTGDLLTDESCTAYYYEIQAFRFDFMLEQEKKHLNKKKPNFNICHHTEQYDNFYFPRCK